MSQLIKELSITVYINEMLSKHASLTPEHDILDKKYYKFQCKFDHIKNDDGYEIFYKVKYRKGFTLFNSWSNCGVFSIYSEGHIRSLMEQCEQFLSMKGFEVIADKSTWS